MDNDDKRQTFVTTVSEEKRNGRESGRSREIGKSDGEGDVVVEEATAGREKRPARIAERCATAAPDTSFARNSYQHRRYLIIIPRARVRACTLYPSRGVPRSLCSPLVHSLSLSLSRARARSSPLCFAIRLGTWRPVHRIRAGSRLPNKGPTRPLGSSKRGIYSVSKSSCTRRSLFTIHCGIL